MGEYHTLGCAGGSAGGHDESVAGLHLATSEEMLPCSIDEVGGCHRFQQGRPRRRRKAAVDRQYGITFVPCAAEGVDELGPTGQVDRNQMWHDGEAIRREWQE